MIDGLLGRKLGMIQIFDKDGSLRGATVIEAGPCLITQIRTEDRDGYRAVQLGFGAKKRMNKPMRGHLKQQGDLRFLREFNIDDASKHAVGERVGAEMFEEGDRVNITGISKGRGFAGVVKRHHFAGGPKTHGQSDRHRAGGSIGSGNTPGRVFKGMRMAGHMGAEQVTVQGLEVLQSDPVRGILLVAGSVPGARNGLLKIRYSAQTLAAARTRTPKAPEESVEERQPAAKASDDAPPKAADADEEEAALSEANAATTDETPKAEETSADEPEATTEVAEPEASADAADTVAEKPDADEEEAASRDADAATTDQTDDKS
ncbi:MAG: 50S ribosomal protein L3 [Chloroflexi bacterium]|nr:50S ribosomal protein L3 [Chloroflexota bacterium]